MELWVKVWWYMYFVWRSTAVWDCGLLQLGCAGFYSKFLPDLRAMQEKVSANDRSLSLKPPVVYVVVRWITIPIDPLPYRIRLKAHTLKAHTSIYSVKNALFFIPVRAIDFTFFNIVSASLTPASTVRGWFVAVAPNHGMRNGWLRRVVISCTTLFTYASRDSVVYVTFTASTDAGVSDAETMLKKVKSRSRTGMKKRAFFSQ